MLEDYDKIVEDNKLYLSNYLTVLESDLDPDMLEVVNNTIGQLEKWLDDIGEMRDVIMPIICYKHIIRSTQMMKEMTMEKPEND